MPSLRSAFIALALALLIALLQQQSREFVFSLWDILPSLPATCRCARGEKCWPTTDEWHRLNDSTGGQLLISLPLGAPCHEPQHDEGRCNQIREAWRWPEVHVNSPTSVMNPFFQYLESQACHPFSDPAISCSGDEHGLFALNVTSAAVAATGLTFARSHDIRVVIKNTGHEYTGKSASNRDTLTLWTHHLDSISGIPAYRSDYYNGTAIKLGAGVLAADVMRAAKGFGVRVVGGFCPSVGVAGGYIQGGGHGPLTSTYGMAADQVLEWEVVTSDGQLVSASPAHNADLYWALAGGGGGVFGVVISVTIRVFKDDEPVGGASLVVLKTDQPSDEVYWRVFSAWQDALPQLLDNGATAGYAITREAFFVQPITVVGASSSQMEVLLRPLASRLDRLNATYSLSYTGTSNYFDHYERYQGPFPWGAYPVDLLFGGKMIPRRVLDHRRQSLVSTIQHIIQDTEAFLGFVAINNNRSAPGGPQVAPIAPNSVLPAWESAALTVLAQYHWNLTAPREQGISRASEMTNLVVPALSKLGGEGDEAGTYMNEADQGLENWQTEFFGSNWRRLSEVKRKWDTEGFLWAPMTPRSQDWRLNHGRLLCRPSWTQQLQGSWIDTMRYVMDVTEDWRPALYSNPRVSRESV